MVVYDQGSLQQEAATLANHNSGGVAEEVPPVDGAEGVPRVVLLCRENSHPFTDRQILASQPIKVGRHIARCRQAVDNAIFDCKVLSRNHALLWYENGKFYLQDTGSSNGTFVNNQRLSKGSEESQPWEVSSGDIVQFGVDVLENSRKVTHGCIIATLKLYLPDGKEAKASATTAVTAGTPDITITSQELYQLSQYLQEALHREQILENKLSTLQKVVASSNETSLANWKAMIHEDQLLSKIEALQNQLYTCSKNVTEDTLKEELLKLHAEKEEYQKSAKESLENALHGKLETVKKVQDLEISLNNMGMECAHLQQMYEGAAKELQLLSAKYDEAKKDAAELAKKLWETEEHLEEASLKASTEKASLETMLEETKKQMEEVSSKLETVQAEYEFSKEQLAALKGRLEHLKDSSDDYVQISKGVQVEISPKEQANSNLKAQLKLSKEEEEKNVNQTLALQAEITRLKSELDQVHLENEKNDISTKTFRQHNGDVGSGDSLDHLREEMERLRELLDEAREQKKTALEEVTKLEGELASYQKEQTSLKSEIERLSQDIRDKTSLMTSLMVEVKQVQGSLEEAHSQIHTLTGKLEAEELASCAKSEEICTLHGLMEQEKQNSSKQAKAIAELQYHSQEIERKYLAAKDEAETTHQKLELEKTDAREAESRHQALQQENSMLRGHIEALKAEINRHKSEKLRLEGGDSSVPPDDVMEPSLPREEVNKLEEELERLRGQLGAARQESLQLQERYGRCNQKRATLQQELECLTRELDLLSVQTRTASACAIVPLLILLLALVAAFQPALATLTATWD